MFMLMCKLSCADVYIHMYMYASIRSYAYVYIHIHVHTYSYVYVDSCDVHTLQHEFMKTHLQHVQSFEQLVGGEPFGDCWWLPPIALPLVTCADLRTICEKGVVGGCLPCVYHLLYVQNCEQDARGTIWTLLVVVYHLLHVQS